MKLSTTTDIYYKRPDGRKISYVDCIDKCADAGFDCIDLMFHRAIVDPNNELCGADWKDQVQKIAEKLEARGMTANQCHTPFYDYLDPDLKGREEKWEMTRRAVEAAGMLGVKWIVFHPGTIFGNPSKQANMQANIEYMKPFIELAAKYGSGIAFENIFDKFMIIKGSYLRFGTPLHDHLTTGQMRTCRSFASWPEELIEYTDEMSALFPDANIGICWDVGHGNEMLVDQRISLQLIGKRLKALHVNDNKGVYDDHLIPYIGNVDWNEFMRTLAEIGYEGDFTYETEKFFLNIPEELVDDTLKLSVKYGRHLIHQFEQMR